MSTPLKGIKGENVSVSPFRSVRALTTDSQVLEIVDDLLLGL